MIPGPSIDPPEFVMTLERMYYNDHTSTDGWIELETADGNALDVDVDFNTNFEFVVARQLLKYPQVFARWVEGTTAGVRQELLF